MLVRCRVHRFLAQLAAESAAAYAQKAPPRGDGLPPALWVDDCAGAAQAEEDHRCSTEYKELHRPALTTSAMGLFGGEPGFEKAHRVWVDPDRPHMKHVFNQTVLAKNLRYARYGYFKRDMHLLDVDKLIRHARLLPTPNRLLSDFLLQRVPLSDRSCAAFIRYQRDQMEMLDEWRRPASFQCAVELFERMVVTNLPPVEVGVETHAEMIRCCAVMRDWHNGWEVYLTRAREVAAAAGETDAWMGTALFDAVLELCVRCERPAEGMEVMEEAIGRHVRPRATMLERTMVLAALAVEHLGRLCPTEGETAEVEGLREAFVARGRDAWALYDFYEHPRTTATVEAYLSLGALLDHPTWALEAVRYADTAGLRLSLTGYHWLLYALRRSPGRGDYVMDTFAQLAPRGLTADYLLFTVAFMYCAHQRDGELAVALYHQHLAAADLRPTPEMTLLFVQACAHSAAPRVEMLTLCETLLERLEHVGSVVDRRAEIYDQYLELAAHLGAVGAAWGIVKRLVAVGESLTTRMMNSLLLANAHADPPHGGRAMTTSLQEVATLLRIAPNKDTLRCLTCCLEAFGSTPALEAWRSTLAERAEDPAVGEDLDLPILDDPPHRLRQLRMDWRLRPRDTALRRYGQHTSPRPREAVGSMLGSIVPFGRSPGERAA